MLLSFCKVVGVVGGGKLDHIPSLMSSMSGFAIW